HDFHVVTRPFIGLAGEATTGAVDNGRGVLSQAGGADASLEFVGLARVDACREALWMPEQDPQRPAEVDHRGILRPVGEAKLRGRRLLVVVACRAMDGAARTLERTSTADGDVHGDAESAAAELAVEDLGAVQYREPFVDDLTTGRGNIADLPHARLAGGAQGFLHCD